MNIFEIEKLTGIEEEEIVDILKENRDVKIERIISTGQDSDWMVQEGRNTFSCFKVMQLLNLMIKQWK